MNRVSLLVFIILLTITALFALVPRTMTYQGKLTNTDGIAIEGEFEMTFRLWDAEEDGNLLSEEMVTVTITKGLFDVALDFETPPRDSLKFDKPYWFEITIDDETLTPREKLSSSSYAYRAIYADTAYYSVGGGLPPGAEDQVLRMGESTWEATGLMVITGEGQIGMGTTEPHPSARLELSAIDRGFLIPRMTEGERDDILSPADALLIFNTSSECLQIFNADDAIWETIYCYNDCRPSITSHPSYQTICAGDNTEFSVVSNGRGLIWRWQVDEGAGFVDIVSAGSNPIYENWTTASLNVNSVIAGNDGNRYRCIVEGECAPPDTSNWAVLTVHEEPLPPIAEAASEVESGGFVANWSPVEGALYYLLDVSDASDFSTFISGFENLNVGNVTSKVIGGMVLDTRYYYRVSVVTDCGASVESNIIDVWTTDCPILAVGDIYGGGVVVHTSYPGCDCGYLVVSPDELADTGVVWGCMGTSVGGTASTVGTGAANTASILSGCSQPGIPAVLCEVYNSGGFTDWFLPSRSELNVIADVDTSVLYPALRTMGGEGLKFSYYWSSTEGTDPANEAWNHHMWMDLAYSNSKISTNRRVRAVRCF